MKICVIGAGAQGSVIAKILAEDPEIDKVVLADINTQLLQRVAKKIDSSKLSTERVDAGNLDNLAKVLKGADVAVNVTLTQYNLPIFYSALKNGANYMDFAISESSRAIRFVSQTSLMVSILYFLGVNLK